MYSYKDRLRAVRIPAMLRSLCGWLSSASAAHNHQIADELACLAVRQESSLKRWATPSVVHGQPGAQRPALPALDGRKMKLR